MSSATEVRAAGLDKFYTKPDVAARCLNRVGEKWGWREWDLVVEPSAGNGSFYTQIPVEARKKVGLDIAPEHDDVIAQDFFTYSPGEVRGRVLVVGNPPFGRVSSLAVRFFNHAAEWADAIAFIVPRTFRRVSVHNKLDPGFHLVCDEDVAVTPCAFTPPMSAKCCFQIWERREELRPKVKLPSSHADWDFLKMGPKDDAGQPTPPAGADFALRAYGGRCGEIVTEGLSELRPKSWHWIRANIDQGVLINRLRALDYSESTNTARQNSIGKGELVRLYSTAYDQS